MKKIGQTGMRWLKIFHIVFVALWFGGVMSMITLRFGLKLTSFEEASAAYSSMRAIDDYLIRNGAQGILLTGIIYGIWTNWGFLKQRWVAVKWAIFIVQLIFGIFFLNRWVGGNITLLETMKGAALSNPVFLNNNSLIKIGIITQAILMVMVIGISVFKPWKKKSVSK